MREIAGVQHELRRNGSALMRAIVSRNVAATSWFAGFLNPMWLSLICTKFSVPAGAASAGAPGVVCPSARDVSTPPLRDQSTPVPAQAMHFKKPRRSMPSAL